MRLLLNVIWLVFGGLVMAFGYAVVALVMFILIITIPFGVASARIALFCLWPFGRTLVRRPGAGAGSLIGNVIWFVLAGWWLALGPLVSDGLKPRCASTGPDARPRRDLRSRARTA